MALPIQNDVFAELAALRARTETLERRERELVALLHAHEAVTSSLDLGRSLDAIVRQAASITGGSDTWLLVLDEDNATLRCRVSVSMSREEMDTLVMRVGEGLSGRVAQRREPLSIPDMRHHPYLWHPGLAAKHNHVSYLGIPVMLGDRLFGVLAISTPEPRTHTDAEIEFLSVFARQAAIALENARLYEMAQRELAERTRTERALRESEERYRRISVAVTDYIYTVRMESGQAVETWHGPGCVAVTGYTAEEFAADPNLWIAMVDEADRDAVRERSQRILAGEDVPPIEHRITRKDGARRWVRNTAVLQQRDSQRRLIAYDGLIQDVTAQRSAEEALRARTKQLETIRLISEEITGELDLRALLDLILRRATELVGAQAGSILLWDEEAGVLIPHAEHGFGDWQRHMRVRLGEGLVGLVAERRAGMIVNDYRSWPHALPTTLQHSTMTAGLAEPLLYKGRLLGVLAVGRMDAEQPFRNEDRILLELFADQAAIAIENARLYEAAVRRGWEMEALASATRSVTSGLNLQEILARILEEAARITDAPHVKVLLLDKAAGVLRVGALKGSSMPPDHALPVGIGSSGIVAQTGKTLYMADAQNDPRNVFAEADREMGIVTYLGLPITRGEEILGVLTFNTTVPRRYSRDELIYLNSFADQAAVAIENARLYEAARHELEERTRAEAALRSRARQLEALRIASDEIARELELPLLLDLITRRALELVCAPVGALRLWDDTAQCLIPQSRFGFRSDGSGPTFRLGEGVSGVVAQRREGMMVNDFRNSPFATSELLATTKHTAVLGEPLIYRDRLIGVLTAGREHGEPFNEDDRNLLGLFAGRAAVAIENARLFRELNQSYTDLQKAQDELIRAEKLRALGQMSAGIAHDLNNMLAAILGQVELLRLRTQDSEIRESLRMLETAATDGAHVVRRLQDFARQRGRSPLAPLDLSEVVAESLEITRPRWRDEVQRQGRFIDVQFRLGEIPAIMGHAPEVREILINLILNAVDAMPQGGTLTFTAAVSGTSDRPAEEVAQPTLPPTGEPAWVELHVSDTGVGMSEEVRKRIFDPFFSTKGGRGTGLGLSVVYSIMERHGGRIAVSSAPGWGTTVTLHFQAARAVPEDVEPSPAQAPGVTPKRLLLIDDDPMVRGTLASLLRAAGHTVTEADGGSAGVALLGKDGIDLVLTDLGMPEVTGWDVAAAARAWSARTPVILLTGWGEQGAETPAPGLVDRVLGKPVRLEDLLAVIAELT